jgi:hypothetical protein
MAERGPYKKHKMSRADTPKAFAFAQIEMPDWWPCTMAFPDFENLKPFKRTPLNYYSGLDQNELIDKHNEGGYASVGDLKEKNALLFVAMGKAGLIKENEFNVPEMPGWEQRRPERRQIPCGNGRYIVHPSSAYASDFSFVQPASPIDPVINFSQLAHQDISKIMEDLLSEGLMIPGPGHAFHNELLKKRLINERTFFEKYVEPIIDRNIVTWVLDDLGISAETDIGQAVAKCFNLSYYIAYHKSTPLAAAETILEEVCHYIADSGLGKTYSAFGKMPLEEAEERISGFLRYAQQAGVKYFRKRMSETDEWLGIISPVDAFVPPSYRLKNFISEVRAD